jgi:hypothetical protein
VTNPVLRVDEFALESKVYALVQTIKRYEGLDIFSAAIMWRRGAMMLRELN